MNMPDGIFHFTLFTYVVVFISYYIIRKWN